MEFKLLEIDEHLLVVTNFPQRTQTTQRPSIVQAVRKEVANRVLAIAFTALQDVCAYPAPKIWATTRRRRMQRGWESTELGVSLLWLDQTTPTTELALANRNLTQGQGHKSMRPS